jgi:DNA-binding response OmpR family regulator
VPRPSPPHIVLLAAEWQPRALMRAQLIEEGFEVVATDTWPMMRRHLRPGSKPQLAIVDLKGLSDPLEILTDLRVLMEPDRVLVVTALGTIPPLEMERFGFHVLTRPITVQDIVAAAAQHIQR